MIDRVPRIAAGLAAAMTAAVGLAACGGPSAQQQAVTLMRSQTVTAPNGTPLTPSSVHCTNASTPNCTVVYPDGERDTCSVSIDGGTSNSSCTATGPLGSKGG